MTSNIEAIRAAEEQVLILREQLKTLGEEARADDGIIDAEEQGEIDRVESKVDSLRHVISLRRKAWTANKADYERLRSDMAADLKAVKANTSDEFSKDQKAILDAEKGVDKEAAEQDFGNALKLARAMQRLVDLFVKLVENDRIQGLTDEELTTESLADEAIDEVFSDEYMRDLMDIEFKVEKDPTLKPKLKDLMDEIKKGLSSSRLPDAMQELEICVGPPPSAKELEADHARFLVLRKQRDAIGKKKDNGPIDNVDETKHPDFSASREQLMFGKVLGDALGIHEVFASILSPTGGLVGPGNELIPGCVDSPHLSPDNPVALHGTVHDAAGYLKSFHDEGPGYNYRNDPIEGFATDLIGLLPEDYQKNILPLTGQASGIWHWTMEAGDEYLEARYDEGVLALEKALADARNGAAAKVGELISNVESAKKGLADAAEALKDDVEARKAQAEQDIRDFAERVETEALEVVEGFEDAVGKAASSAVEVYEEAAAEARAIGGSALEKLDAVASFIWS